MGRNAMVNERGLIINGLIHLEPSGATIFYWCMAALSAVFVVVAVPAFFVGLLSSQHVILTSTEISAPKFGFSGKATVVKLSDIKSLSVQEIQKERFLNIQHANGNLSINASFLPDKAAFEELCSTLAERVSVQARG